MVDRNRIISKLLLIVVALNITGIVCFSATSHASNPLASKSLEPLADPSYALDSIGFTLMLPGIFFAALAFLCAHAFAWNEATARIVWYATAFAINVIAAWRAGKAIEYAQQS